jgi:hypothetical protein
MSEVKVNKITPTADCGTVTLGDSGDTVAIPAGVTLTSGGALQNSGTITNTGSITGVAITGTIDNQVNWQTTVKTTGFTATAGEGYFCDTTSAAFTVTLPASPSAGDLVGIKDYANTADTNNITIGRNGSNIEGVANDFVITVEGGSITLIYVDATKGWLSTAAAKASDIVGPEFVTATGGTITTCGDFKIHTFTGPGTFCVSNAGNPIGSETVSYLVVGAGGGSGYSQGGGGGAGGFRESKAANDTYTASPLNATSGPTYNLPISVQGYPITVGSGGAGAGSGCGTGSPGGNSIFSTITSTGGGGGGRSNPTNNVGANGGSGGGGGGNNANPGGTGNTPPVSPPQGQNGGRGGNPGIGTGGGGGGALCTGAQGNDTSPYFGGAGGDGAATLINPATGEPSGCTQYYAGGGAGGSGGPPGPGSPNPGGLGGGGDGKNQGMSPSSGETGTANTGGGGGGSDYLVNGVAGGSGIVIIRYKYQ